MPDRTVLITGANGFLGRELCAYFSRHRWRVRALVRNPTQASVPGVDSAQFFRFELGQTIDESALAGTPDTLIHCAWGLDPSSADSNLAGTRLLIDQVRASGLGQLIFISTLSAHDGAESVYGITKFAAEKAFDQPGDLVVRPGLIIGSGGLFQRMMRSIAKLPLIPLFYGGHQKIQYISSVQLCECLLKAARSRITGRLNVAHSEPLDIRRFYSVCAASLGKKARFVRLPGPLTDAVLRRIEKRFAGTLPITSENLAGLRKMRVFPTADDLAKLGVEAEDLKTILAKL